MFNPKLFFKMTEISSSSNSQFSPSGGNPFLAYFQKIMDYCVSDEHIAIRKFLISNSIPNLSNNLKEYKAKHYVTIGLICSSLEDSKEAKDFFLRLLKDFTNKKKLLDIQNKPECVGEYSEEDRIRFIFKSQALILQVYVSNNENVINEIMKKI
ncbi:MAG: hypothetical protein WC089_01920 [Candidatus Paceibacterota bacterium]